MKNFLKLFTLFVGIFSLILLISTESFAGEGNPKAGKAIYVTNCALCHGLDGISPVAAATPELHVPNFANGDRVGQHPLKCCLNQYVRDCSPIHQPPPMPPWCKILSEEEIRNALAYVKNTQEISSRLPFPQVNSFINPAVE